MQISHFAVAELESRELRGPTQRPPGTYSFVVCIPPNSSGIEGCAVSVNAEMGLLGTPEGRAQILANPRWPWIAVQLTSRRETSHEVTRKKWNLLSIGILMNIKFGILSLDPEFLEPPSFGLSGTVYIPPQQMARWYAALKSIDFWYPLLLPNPSKCILFKCLLALQMDGEREHLPDGDAADNNSESIIPLALHY